jgi:hypothetical protein
MKLNKSVKMIGHGAYWNKFSNKTKQKKKTLISASNNFSALQLRNPRAVSQTYEIIW